jgi:hypothetical protein
VLAVAAAVTATAAALLRPTAAVSAAVAPSARALPPAPPPFDPIALASASVRKVVNREAPIPPQCYTKTEGAANPCWTCHTTSTFPNAASDWELQKDYAFSDVGKTNHWTNLFQDRRAAAQRIDDAAVLAYVRQDNYSALKQALATRPDYPGYRPDLDFELGFDEQGFARDGSGWRAFRYKPFPGVFWPTNGNTDDVMVRLPAAFRLRDGVASLAVYRGNLAILEASFSSDPRQKDAQVRWPSEPLDETELGVDLDADGKLVPAITELRGLPTHYLGDARHVKVRRGLFPAGVELLHSVRYLDPDAPSAMAKRMKELRYSRKAEEREDWAILRAYEVEANEKEEGQLPVFPGSPLVGLQNDFGWRLQGFIEDSQGRLRLQTHEEHLACMGCHSNLGVTVDQTFSFARKVPGRDGWRYQDLRGMPDAPQLGHREPEFLTYLRRAAGGDEFRENAEILERYFPNGRLEPKLVVGDLAALVMPSRKRALDLNRAYMALVASQVFERGRDTTVAPARNVHAKIEQESTGLEGAARVYMDGQLRLAWDASVSRP